MSTTTSTELLRQHFEKLKNSIPEVYEKSAHVDETNEDKMFAIIKRSLSIIEAVYFQNSEMFTASRAEEYALIIADLKKLEYNYTGNVELLNKATKAAILSAKLPMEKAKGNKEKSSSTDTSRRAM